MRNPTHLTGFCFRIARRAGSLAAIALTAIGLFTASRVPAADEKLSGPDRYRFDQTISREVPDHPQQAILKVGFAGGLYGRSKGGTTYSGWSCEHLPYLVELDNWGASKQPGQAKAGGIWIWGYDEITWFAHQSQQYRSNWLRYARNWVRETDRNGHLEMPGSRTMVSPLDRKRWYYANKPSTAVPDGLGDEDAIRALWAAD